MKKGILLILMTFLLAVLGCGTIRAASAPKLSETSLQLQKGESATLKLKGAKEKRVKWISKNNEIASIEKGIVKAEGAGTTKIIAKYKGKKYICKITVTEAADDPVDESGEDETQRRMLLTIDGARLDVEWESNDSVEALKKLLPLTISMSEYGGFEQVGDLGTTLPRSDERITTSAGDIVLYNGDEISVFYDSNSWSYTRLGRITGKSKADLRELLGKDNVTAELSFEEEASKTMVVYFSQTGSTKGVAEKIADIAEAELQRIEPEIPYTEEDLNYNDSSSRATREQNDLSQRPRIKNEITLAGCRTLYLGYPIWWGQAPRIMDTFVEGPDFTGITVIPFCTSGSSGIEKSAKRLEELAGSGTWMAGNRFSANASLEELTEWVEKQK